MITATEAACRLGLTRQAFHVSILPQLIQRGQAIRIGRYYAVDEKAFSQWEKYAEERKEKILSGEWSPKRPWRNAPRLQLSPDSPALPQPSQN